MANSWSLLATNRSISRASVVAFVAGTFVVAQLVACTSASIEMRLVADDDAGTPDGIAPAETALDAASGDSSVAEASDASADVVATDGNKAALCAETFGTSLTAPYGRLDGTVLAVLKPTDQHCPRPNGDHLIVQVTTNGAPYRMVVNVLATFSGVDPNVRLKHVVHGLIGPPWAEGWHTDVTLDYVTNLAVANDTFTPYPMTELSERVTEAIAIGDKVSIFASTSGGDSAHLVHRNRNQRDGAIVLHADGPSPEYLLFAFANQTF